jgi:hypothetical protein
MKRGCTGRISKQKLNHRSGWENRRRDQKRHVRVNQMRKRLRAPSPSSLNLLIRAMKSEGAARRHWLYCCVTSSSNVRGVSKQYGEATAAFQITITKFNEQHNKTYTEYTKIHNQGTNGVKQPKTITCRQQSRQRIS